MIEVKGRVLKTAIFSAKSYDRNFLALANVGRHDLRFIASALSADTVEQAAGCEAVCIFVNDNLDRQALMALYDGGVRLVVIRATGYDNVDIGAATDVGILVARAPAYSPNAVAEHTIGLILALNRKVHLAHDRVRIGNFALDGLLGFNLQGRTVGVIGTGAIGRIVAHLLLAFGCRVLANDPVEAPELRDAGVVYTSRDEIFAVASIVTLHCPLTNGTRHLVNADALASSRRGLFLVNTGRGALVDTSAAIAALKTGILGAFALDVCEGEEPYFFEDHSSDIISNDVLARLLTFPNVLMTPHQGFFTHEALSAIAEATIANIEAFAQTGRPLHEIPHG